MAQTRSVAIWRKNKRFKKRKCDSEWLFMVRPAPYALDRQTLNWFLVHNEEVN